VKRKVMSLESKRAMFGYIFCLPFILGILIFTLYPFVMSFILSISKITELSGLKTSFIGLKNYVELFTVNTDFIPAFLETIKITLLFTPFIVVLSLFIAILLNQNIMGKGIFRVIFFLPVLLGTGLVMTQLGDAANILKAPPEINRYIDYYFSSDFASILQTLLTEVIRIFWKTGVQIIIFMGGLQAIPESYYEAARVDNANSWDMFWKITLPMLSPIILLNVIFTLIDSFRDVNNPIAKLIVAVVFHVDYEVGSAMGWMYFIVAFMLVGITALIFRRFVFYEK
jgi:ABC-type sugar transport system permease subunit